MSGAGSALMGIGSARGDNRALLAAEQAIASPLLEASMEGAHGVLLSISGGSDLGLFEINEAASLVSDAAHADANIIFGAVIDDALGDEVRVTVIAAGFDSGRPSARKDGASAAVPGTSASASSAGLPPYRRPMTPSGVQGAGERLVVPQAQQSAAPAPAAPVQSTGNSVSAPVGRTPVNGGGSSVNGGGTGVNGGGITVPPLPPIPGPVAGRRPLSNEDFEEELDIPEFLKG
jgi:cell division protein FtsZ